MRTLSSYTKTKKKLLFKIVVTEFCRYGGQPQIFWTWAYSRKQAKLQVQYKFNKLHGRKKHSFVEMNIDIVLQARK